MLYYLGARQYVIATHGALVGARKYCATTESPAKGRKKANSRVWTFTQSTFNMTSMVRVITITLCLLFRFVTTHSADNGLDLEGFLG